MSLHREDARTLRDRIVSRKISAREVAQHFLDRILLLDGRLGCFLAVDLEGSLAAADECDARLDRGEAPRLLEGLPVGIKDNITVRGMPTTCGSRLLAGWCPPGDAEAVRRVRAAGGVIIGKLNMDEFGMGSSNEHSAVRPVANPWDRSRVPGGSSGGSAAAVAAGLVPLALGSDTGGSVRQPAAFCGVTGVRPTYGRVSRRGLVAFASSLDQIGPMARDADGAGRLYTAIAGDDPRDATSDPAETPAADRSLDPKGVTIGVAPHPGIAPEVQSVVDRALDVFAEAGAKVVPVALPHQEHGVAVYALVANAEAASNLSRYDGVRYGNRATPPGEDARKMMTAARAAGFGAEVKRRLLVGTFALSAGFSEEYYDRARRVRTLIAADYAAAFETADLLVGPTTPTLPFAFGENLADPIAMYRADALTVPASLAGLPATSVPAGLTTDGLPVGLQITGPAGADHRVLGLARTWQTLTDWHEQRPEVVA